jgi:hypothetical protein
VGSLGSFHPVLGNTGEPEVPQILTIRANNPLQTLLMLQHQMGHRNLRFLRWQLSPKLTIDTPKVPSTPSPFPTNSPNAMTYDTSMPINTVKGADGMEKVRDVLGDTNIIHTSSIPVSYHVASPPKIVTLLDSGASDHCFVERDIFNKHYHQINPPRLSHSAGKGSTFSIEGVGTAKFMAVSDGISSRIVMADTLHIPLLRSNLISVSS